MLSIELLVKICVDCVIGVTRKRPVCSALSWMCAGIKAQHIAVKLAFIACHRSRIRILRIFSFLKFNEFYDFFQLKKIRKKIVILQIIDILLVLMFWNVTFIYNAFIRTTDHCKVQTAFVSLFYIFINMKP